MKEKKIQYLFVTWYGQKYPQYYGHLIEINNDAETFQKIQHRRAMGMIPGASDLLLIAPGFARVAGIEIKAPGSKHARKHIERQMFFGKVVNRAGGVYLITAKIDVLKKFADAIMDNDWQTARALAGAEWDEILEKLKTGKKEIKF